MTVLSGCFSYETHFIQALTSKLIGSRNDLVRRPLQVRLPINIRVPPAPFSHPAVIFFFYHLFLDTAHQDYTF